ncbi:MAG: efflux RND transporter periplasmic adaptor subunit [Desulfobacterales bacterium]|nr:efflux RND transporter periplasmic adaptor subunit [Desulfobacterales bacterium]
MRNKKWRIVLILLIAVSLGVIFVIILKQKQSPVVGINLISPAYGTIQTSITTTATITPENRLAIKPPVNGRVDKILVREGDYVKVGQTLALMSSTERATVLDAARAQGKEQLAYWEEVYKPAPLLAPINGQVIVQTVQPGQTVTTSDAVTVLSDRLIVQAQVDETDIGKVKLGQAAVITLDAYPDTKVQGTVDHIYYESTIINNVTMYIVNILPKKVPAIFRSGMSANVDIIEQSKDNVLMIPLEAVKQDAEGSFVLISPKNGEKTAMRRVQLGISDDKNVEVISGLETADKIVIASQNYQPSKDTGSGTNPFLPSRRPSQPSSRP